MTPRTSVPIAQVACGVVVRRGAPKGVPEGLGNDSSLSDECFEPDFRITQVIIGAAPKAPQGNETPLTPDLLLAQGEKHDQKHQSSTSHSTGEAWLATGNQNKNERDCSRKTETTNRGSTSPRWVRGTGSAGAAFSSSRARTRCSSWNCNALPRHQILE